MDSEMQAVTRRNIVVVAGYLDVYMGIDRAGLSDVHEEYGLANEDGIQVLDCATAFEGRIMNTFYQNRITHIVSNNSGE